MYSTEIFAHTVFSRKKFRCNAFKKWPYTLWIKYAFVFFYVSYKSGKVLQNIWSILNAAFSNFIEAVTFRAVKDKKCIVRVVIVVRHFVHKKIKCKFLTTFTAINRFFVCLFVSFFTFSKSYALFLGHLQSRMFVLLY